MKVILIRHGESKANALNGQEYKMFTGQYDCELTELGKEQAGRLKGNPLLNDIDAVYCSDLMRAMSTAKLVTEHELIIDSRIRERSLGDFEGRLVDDIKQQPAYEKYFTNEEYTSFRHDFNMKAPNGENYFEVCKRVSEFWNEVVQKGFDKVVIVSHMCTIRCLMKIILGLSEKETLEIKVRQCEPIEINI